MTRRLPLWVERVVSQTRVERGRAEADLLRQQSEDGPVSCSEGCAHCCHYPLHLSVLEGITVYRDLVARGQWAGVKSSVLAHFEQVKGLTLPVWFLAAIPCPLLQNNRCRAYTSRPLVCRATISRTDPAACDPHRMTLPDRPLALQVFTNDQGRKQRDAGLRTHMVPLSLALLLAEKVETGEVDLDEVDRAVAHAYRK